MPRCLYLTLTDADDSSIGWAANLTGTSSNALLGGFVRLCWFMWLEDRTTVTRLHLAGFFGPEVDPEPLVAFGLLARDGDCYRVPGRPRVEARSVELDGDGNPPRVFGGEC